jgi:hypothetical protein
MKLPSTTPLPLDQAIQRAINQLLTVASLSDTLGVTHEAGTKLSLVLAEIAAGLTQSAKEVYGGEFAANGMSPLITMEVEDGVIDDLLEFLDDKLNGPGTHQSSSTQKTFFYQDPG